MSEDLNRFKKAVKLIAPFRLLQEQLDEQKAQSFISIR